MANQALKSKDYDTYAAHQSKKDGTKDWKDKDKRVVDLAVKFLITDKIEFFGHVGRCNRSILTAHAGVVTHLESLIASLALSAAVPTTTYVGLVVTAEEGHDWVLVWVLHNKIAISCSYRYGGRVAKC